MLTHVLDFVCTHLLKTYSTERLILTARWLVKIVNTFVQCFIFRIIEGEVFLVWDGGDKIKSQRDLAKGAKLGVKDDVKILDYYR